MIITTTPSIEGRRIVDYRGIVFGEVVSGVDFVRDLAASFTNFFGGRSGGYAFYFAILSKQPVP